jgi:enoyl-CoA hydratase/carnithine racemase
LSCPFEKLAAGKPLPELFPLVEAMSCRLTECSDLVIASPRAQFSLPEAKRGIYAAAGGLPRIMRIAGLQVASEIALTGRPISAEQGKAWLFVNRISKTHESLIDEAVKFAQEISDLSPDAVLITRAGIREAWDVADIHAAVSNVQDRFGEKLMTSPNTMEGPFNPSHASIPFGGH